MFGETFACYTTAYICFKRAARNKSYVHAFARLTELLPTAGLLSRVGSTRVGRVFGATPRSHHASNDDSYFRLQKSLKSVIV